MKSFNYRIILYSLVAISLWGICSIELEIVPKIPSSFSVEFTEKINHIFLSLSYSILSAYIFYEATSELPRKVQIHRSKKILGQYVYNLISDLFVMINQILYVFDIKKDILDVKEKDLAPINSEISKKYNGYYGIFDYKNTLFGKGKYLTGINGIKFTFPDSIYETLNKIPVLIQKMRKSNPNYSVDEHFAEILSSIETNKIIELYADKKQHLFLYSDSSKYLYELLTNYKNLLKTGYCKTYRNCFQQIRFFTQEEKDNIQIKRDELRTIVNQRFMPIYMLSPCILYDNNCNISKSIVATLNNGLIIDRNSNTIGKQYKTQPITDNEIDDECKCIILVINWQISAQIINNIIDSNKGKLIIIVKPSIYHTSKPKYFKKQNGAYIVFYRSEFSFLRLKFNSQYPSSKTMGIICSNIDAILKDSYNYYI